MSIGTTVIELHVREFKEKQKNNNMDKMGKMFSSNWKRKWYFSEIILFHTLFDMFYTV